LGKDNGMNRRLNVALLGAAGSGKGTQAERLGTEFGSRHIASGDLFRDHLKRSTLLGEMARAYMNRGELAPDDITDAMIEEALAGLGADEGFILDGFPRTKAQAGALEEMLARMGRALDAVIYIHVPDAVLVERLSGRLVCSVCEAPYHLKFHPPRVAGVCDKCGSELYQRDDDRADTVRSRLKTFHKETEPLIQYYRNGRLLIEVGGEAEISAVTQIIGRHLHALRGSGPRRLADV
jgi:adenylate kinase